MPSVFWLCVNEWMKHVQLLFYPLVTWSAVINPIYIYILLCTLKQHKQYKLIPLPIYMHAWTYVYRCVSCISACCSVSGQIKAIHAVLCIWHVASPVLSSRPSAWGLYTHHLIHILTCIYTFKTCLIYNCYKGSHACQHNSPKKTCLQLCHQPILQAPSYSRENNALLQCNIFHVALVLGNK